MRIEYNYTFADSVAFQAAHQFLSPRLQALYACSFLFILWLEAKERPLAVAIATAGTIWLAMWLVQFVVNALILASRSNQNVITTHVAEVKEDGLLEQTEFTKSLFYWPGIVKIVSPPGFVAVYVSQQQALVIPRRAFSSKDEMLKFQTLIAERMRFAKRAA